MFACSLLMNTRAIIGSQLQLSLMTTVLSPLVKLFQCMSYRYEVLIVLSIIFTLHIHNCMSCVLCILYVETNNYTSPIMIL